MPRLRLHNSNAEKQRRYRQRQEMKRNTVAPIDVTKSALYCMDALVFLKSLPSQSVDLVLTSPPYNIRTSTGGFFRTTDKTSSWKGAQLRTGYDGYSDNMPRALYVQWQRACLEEMLRIVGPAGAIFYNHKPRVQAGLLESPDEIVRGLPVRQVIIWDRGQGFNFNDGYFAPSYEVIYLIAKPKFRLCPGANVHFDVWRIPPARNNDHPAPFPIEIPYRIIASTNAQTVVDPFIGSGTTAISAKMLGRKYIGADQSQKYIDEARERIRNAPDTYQQYLFEVNS